MSLGAFNFAGMAVYAIAIFAIATSRYRLVSAACIALILLTYGVPANNAMQALPWISVTLPLIRVLGALAVLTIEFWQFRTDRNAVKGSLFAIGTVFLALSVIDTEIMAITRHTPPHAVAVTTLFRDESVKPDQLEKGSILLVGDSFVWGAGVAKEEAFGSVLEHDLASDGTPRKVYSLGIVGAGPETYVRIMEAIPTDAQASQVILAFYMNDMPMPEQLSDKLRDLSIALGTGAPTFRLLSDVVAKTLTPSADAYHAKVVDSYRKGHGSYARRWAQLETRLEQFADLAVARSSKPPILLILPIMVDFHEYPLNEAHDDLTAMARKLGYEVIDLLPFFKEQLGDGVPYRVTPNDNHFNAEVHALVAKELETQLAAFAGGDSTVPSGSQ